MNPLIGVAFYPDILACTLFFGAAAVYYKSKTSTGSCWAITLSVVGWLFFAKGTAEVCQIIHVSLIPSETLKGVIAASLFYTIYTKFGVGLFFLFAAYILRSLEDALDHFKTQSVWASNYYSSLVEKDSPSVPPHEIELKDGVEDR